ncbi:MAG: hypothetical protein ACXVEE_33595 [Polyangiales bacterium]
MGEPRLLILLLVPQVVLAMLAWAVARRAREHVGVATFVSWMLAVDLVREVIIRLRGVAPHPLHGAARFAFHGDQLLVSSWSFVFVACCAHYFLRRQRVVVGVLAAWIVVWLAVVATYPAIVMGRLMIAYQVLFWTALATSWAMILFAMFRRRELRPGLAHLVLILYATSDLVTGAFPFLQDFLGTWRDTRMIALACRLLCILFHVPELLRPAATTKLAREVT